MMTRNTMFTFVMLFVLLISKFAAADDENYFIVNPDQTQKAYRHFAEVNHLNKVLPHIAAGQIDYAIAELRYTLNAIPNHPRALMLIRPVEIAANKTIFGVYYFEKALKLYPQYAITHAQYGWYLVETNRLEAGIFKLKQAIEIDAKLVPAYVWLSRAYSKSGNPELARQTAEQARDLGYKGQYLGEK